MQCYTELTPPTGVTHAISFPFVTPATNNLVLARTSLLQVFSIRVVSAELDTDAQNNVSTDRPGQLADRRISDGERLEQSYLGVDISLQRQDRVHVTKLVLLAEYTLSGTVTSLARVRISNSKTGAELLLVSFRDAKLSLVEWDPERQGISTISIHYYERDDLQRSPWAPDLSKCAGFLTVDPSSRCAVLKFGDQNLAILPFRQLGDDLVMDDYDPDLDGEREENSTSKKTNGEDPSNQNPYAASFVLPVAALDPSLIHLIHLSFLFEYREPTFGVLSSPLATATSIIHERRDAVTYTVFTLDLEQRASTPILSVTGLPYDIYRVIALPSPVGGALLLGGNELVHVDQAGRTNAVGVNSMAKDCSSFSMADQSDLAMRLERCEVEQMSSDNGDTLLVLSTGELVVVTFKLDGRSVSGLSMRKVSPTNGGLSLKGLPSCAVSLGKGKMFVGSEEAESIILGWTRKTAQHARKRLQSESMANGTLEDDFMSEEDAEDYDDDLYAAVDADGQTKSDILDSTSISSRNTVAGDYFFRIHESLFNVAPAMDFVLGKVASSTVRAGDLAVQDPKPQLEMVLASGRKRAGGVTIFRTRLQPKILNHFDYPEVRGLWSIRAKVSITKALTAQTSKSINTDLDGGYSLKQEYHNLVIMSRSNSKGNEESGVYAITSTGFDEMKDTEFDPSAGATVEVGILCNGTRVVQVVKSEVRSYDGDLGLAQIFPLTDEDSETEPTVVSASFADPYVLTLKDDQSIFVISCDESGDLEEVERGTKLSTQKWRSGCLYADKQGVLTHAARGSSTAVSQKIYMFLLREDYSLEIYCLPNLADPVYIAPNVGSLPPVIHSEHNLKRSFAAADLEELLVADLGDSVAKSLYLIFRSAIDDLVIYEPFHVEPEQKFTGELSSLRFLKLPSPQLPKTSTSWTSLQARPSPMRAMSDVSGYSTVFMPGESPSFLLKTATTMPKVMRLMGKGVEAMCSFHTENCEHGWVSIDSEGVLKMAQFPSDTRYAEIGWAVKRIPLGEEVQKLSYHPPMECYLLGTSKLVDFELPKDDELHREWARENISFRPQVDQGTLKLLNPINWTIIESYPLQPYEVILCIKTLTLEVSESTHERKQLIAVGTSNTPVMDQSCRGTIYIFDIIPVIPEPDRPETDRRLKLIAREEVKGPVTAVSEIGTQGFLLMAQGQKCMVRGLKEDGSLLPVAFMDMMCYVSAAKCLPNTGMCLMGDALKGVWFVGYTEEPYRMTLFGKSTGRLEVMAADFLPNGDQLYIVVADADSNLHIFQYDPEHPKSLSGTHLLPLRAFHTGHSPTTLTRLPSSTPTTATTANDSSNSGRPRPTKQQLLLTSTTGALSLLSLLPESSYRRLLSFQSQLTTALTHACGLNPRSYRLGPTSVEAVAERGVLDGAVLGRWAELDVGRRAEILARAGTDEEELREDLRAVGVGGAEGVLGYL